MLFVREVEAALLAGREKIGVLLGATRISREPASRVNITLESLRYECHGKEPSAIPLAQCTAGARQGRHRG